MTDRQEEMSVLILGTADWESTIATNQHYIAKHLSNRYRVYFVEGLGTRRPTLTLADFRRGAARVLRMLRPQRGTARSSPSIGVVVIPGLALPWAGRISRYLNALLLRLQCRAWLQAPKEKRVLWTYTPYEHGLAKRSEHVIFHLVDLIHRNPGVDGVRFVVAERKLAQIHATRAIASSATIETHLRDVGFRAVTVWPNVGNVGPFISQHPRIDDDANMTVLYGGRLSLEKIDFELLEALVDAIRGLGQLKLIGPVGPGVGKSLDSLRRKGVTVLPGIPQADLAEEAGKAGVAILPYDVNELTVGITPLKLFELLAVGLPVVSTALPGISPIPDAVWVENTAESFCSRVTELMSTPALITEGVEFRKSLARRNSWHQRYRDVDTLLASLDSSNTSVR